MSVWRRYSLQNARRVLENPSLLRGELRRLRKDALNANAYVSRLLNDDDRVDVMAEDWDNLVILDACRYDMFAAKANIGDRVTSKLSPGSESWEFMQESFVGKEFHDTVYVTSNPHAYKLPDGTFHAVINLLDDHWDDTFRTVMPETMVEQTLAAFEQYPDKRIITHFMQPHFPFIGEKGRKFGHAGIEMQLDDEEHSDEPHPWNALLYGETDNESEIIEAYVENLNVTLPHVEKLVDELPGKSVITADHGNLIGERTYPIPIRTFGHPGGLHKRELIEVPWAEIDSEERRKITAEPPKTSEAIDDDVIEDRLRNLGYAE
ncbi:hypothetical protein SAMN05421858_0218 [Haladaptatus litoreus]|uniref:Sulfatase n=1 Tax=Haladaptatus litoreus TaxID=553468 RepID=A0A1N6V576_9EURY|nr:hypothetical protein [Haladaptatus litoreus]SIQ73015.1 hypothetical protein SAMN05421858_0218 [Haladaptatus litoreus]